MCRLAGEVADGLHLHPLHSVRYVREVVVPAVQAGLGSAGRGARDCSLVASVIIATGETAAALDAARLDAKRQIAFYASTPNYRPVLECHGWDAIGPELTRKSVRGDWEGMASLISDAMLDGLRNSAVTRLFIDPAIDAASGDVHGKILRLAPLS
jgi:hypothetical protein